MYRSLFSLLLLALLAHWVIIRALEHRCLAGNDYPPDLARAVLVMSEKELAIDRPMRLLAIEEGPFDWTKNGFILPVIVRLCV